MLLPVKKKSPLIASFLFYEIGVYLLKTQANFIGIPCKSFYGAPANLIFRFSQYDRANNVKQ